MENKDQPSLLETNEENSESASSDSSNSSVSTVVPVTCRSVQPSDPSYPLLSPSSGNGVSTHSSVHTLSEVGSLSTDTSEGLFSPDTEQASKKKMAASNGSFKRAVSAETLPSETLSLALHRAQSCKGFVGKKRSIFSPEREQPLKSSGSDSSDGAQRDDSPTVAVIQYERMDEETENEVSAQSVSEDIKEKSEKAQKDDSPPECKSLTESKSESSEGSSKPTQEGANKDGGIQV